MYDAQYPYPCTLYIIDQHIMWMHNQLPGAGHTTDPAAVRVIEQMSSACREKFIKC